MITDLMTIFFVELLEMVHIKHDQRKGMVFQSIPYDLGLKVIEKKTPIVHTGKLVLEDHSRGIFADMFHEMDERLVFHLSHPTSRFYKDIDLR